MIIDPPAVYKMYSESIKNVRVERRPRVMMITDAPAVYKMYSESKKNVRVERRPRVLMITDAPAVVQFSLHRSPAQVQNRNFYKYKIKKQLSAR